MNTQVRQPRSRLLEARPDNAVASLDAIAATHRHVEAR